MDITAARNAMPLVTQIDERTDMLTKLNTAVSGHWVVTSMKMLDPTTNIQHDIILGQLDDATSQQCFQFAISIYQAQIAALEAQLAALT